VDTLPWLLDADPAIRWQAMRDLTGASTAAIAMERARVPREGLGAAILSSQAPNGSWSRPGTPVWLPTLFTLLLLRSTGADPADRSIKSAIERLETTLRWSDEPNWELRPGERGNPFFAGEVEPCINGGVLALGAYFGRPTERLARRLLSEQLPDGGWNCEAPKSTRSSFHTTICVLEGLLQYERAAGTPAPIVPEIAAARRRGEEYLLQRALLRRLSTAEVANPEFLAFAFPPRYHYDVLRALDYFRDSTRDSTAPLDPRFGDAIDLLESKRQPDGRWLLDASYTEAIALPIGESINQPSRWNTFRALRVLHWYKADRLERASAPAAARMTRH
jgi:hypothetical protein